jgi:glycosyltransferase involved in cell wall biosynthesis
MIFQTLIRGLEDGLLLGKDHFLKISIGNYLQARKIRLVLAEFGPVGAALYPITRDMGIPLVVYFHGYDAFNRMTVDRQVQQYRELFREAIRIIVVSEIMLNRLAELGAPREKLVHLPAYVNLGLFPYSDHSLLPPRFLAVGRFAETKSPHLTILAFHKVSQQVPDATLTFIGRGGGGDLLEACTILVRALGLDEKVFFKGVLAHEQIAAEMRQARIFVQHSLTTPETGDQEGKPVAIMEAMSCGLPVVSTRHSGIPELIDEGVTGLLVDEYDIGAMAAAMLQLLQDRSLAAGIGLRASEHIRQHPLISRHIFLLEQLIDDCMESA